MQHTIYLPFVHGTPPKQYRLTATIEEVTGDTLDISANGQHIEIGFLASATVKIKDRLSVAVAIIEEK